MTKLEIISKIAHDTGLSSKDVQIFLESFTRITTEALKEGDSVKIARLGQLQPWRQTERPGRNPRTGTPVTIIPRLSVKFRPSKNLLAELNE